MKETLYSVGMKDKETGENINLKVWAENSDKATAKAIGLFCYRACYRFTGTQALFKNNEIITRIVE